jgi:Fe-S cluster assembly ATP-binding protein
MKLLEVDESFMTRSVNEGFSGGEKKRNEILQMALLEPARYSGRDRLRTRYRCDAHCGQRRQRHAQPDQAIIVITHYQRLLDYIVRTSCKTSMGGR